MSNIYLKLLLTGSQNFDFLGLKNLSPGQIWGDPAHVVSLYFKTSCCNLKIRRFRAKLFVAFLLF